MKHETNKTTESAQVPSPAKIPTRCPLIARSLAGSILAIVVLAVPQIASAFDTANGMNVNEVNENVFEVIPRRGGVSGFAYWCSAGEYAEQKLRAKPTEVVYVVRGPGPAETVNRESAVQFTLNPTAVGVKPGPLAKDANNFNVGGHMQLGLARAYCNN